VNFCVGEKVVYPNQGISVVEAISNRAVPSGEPDRVYELRVLSNDSRVFVTDKRVADVGLRPVVKSSEVRRIFDLLGDGHIEPQGNWKGRFKENSGKKKSLSFREKFMLERARFLIVSEIAEVEGKPSNAIQERVDRALSKTVRPDGNGADNGEKRPRASAAE
jgi:CarD family transcriptional regulator